MADGMAKLSEMIEGGMSHQEAVAAMYAKNKKVIFTGNGYSKEWPVEAAERGLPNLNTTPLATAQLTKGMDVLKRMGVYAEDETLARQEVMFENYVTTIATEVECMINMVKQGFLPACAKDLALYRDAPTLAGDRAAIYGAIKTECANLQKVYAAKPDDLAAEATFLCDTVKPVMDKLRKAVDAAEAEMDAALYPYPTYEALVYGHHF